MPRSRFIYHNGQVVAEFQNNELVRASPEFFAGPEHSLMIIPDTPDVVSPIDGTVIRGRAGMREHCKRHDVVPTAELAGLPPKPMTQPYEVPKAQREETKRYMSYLIDKMERK